jgi:hypothetical protein
METRDTNQNPAISNFDPSHRMRSIVIACALICAATVAQTATATSCPPGYGGVYPHCRPVPPHHAHPQPHYTNTVVPHGGTVPLESKPRSPRVERRIVDPHKVAPVTGPGPRHSQSPIDHGKAALNPQPIPPGHAQHSSPHPGLPIEKKIGH